MTPPMLITALGQAGCRPRGSAARCPAHQDREPSLGFGVHDDGWAWVRCHVGCTREAILDALGLTWRALAPDPEPSTVPQTTTVAHDPQALASWADQSHQRLLKAHEAGHARQYLRSRGVTGADVRELQLGLGVEHSDRRLNRLRGRIVFCEHPWRAEGRIVPGQEAAAYRADRKYQSEGPKRAWGLAGVDPARPVVLVEGMFDRVAVGRLCTAKQVIALCGSTGVRSDDLEALAARGVTEVWVFLDADCGMGKWQRTMADLDAGGIRATAVNGLADGDPGDLLPALTRGDDQAWAAMSAAFTTPQMEAPR